MTANKYPQHVENSGWLRGEFGKVWRAIEEVRRRPPFDVTGATAAAAKPTVFTPAWTNLTLGTGTTVNTGRYLVQNGVMTMWLRVQFGTSGAIATGDTEFTVPGGIALDANFEGGGGGAYYNGTQLIPLGVVNQANVGRIRVRIVSTVAATGSTSTAQLVTINSQYPTPAVGSAMQFMVSAPVA